MIFMNKLKMENMSNPTYTDLLEEELDFIFKFLKDKNEKYGSSIMEPLGIFHKGTTIEAINARIDDKLARIKNQSTDEDAELDLLGYLLWKRVLIKQNK
jgi:hypothetical protein